jgi:hypothetical protein
MTSYIWFSKCVRRNEEGCGYVAVREKAYRLYEILILIRINSILDTMKLHNEDITVMNLYSLNTIVS